MESYRFLCLATLLLQLSKERYVEKNYFMFQMRSVTYCGLHYLPMLDFCLWLNYFTLTQG
jgi:hypothetical protein